MKLLIEESVLRQALEALEASMSMMDEYSYRQTICGEKGFDTLRAITALRSALEQSEVECGYAQINDLIYAIGAPLGSENYFKIRDICCKRMKA